MTFEFEVYCINLVLNDLHVSWSPKYVESISDLAEHKTKKDLPEVRVLKTFQY